MRPMPRLTAADRAEIEALIAVCREHEPGLDLPLYLAPARPGSGETINLGYYHNDVLVGLANLTPGTDIEVQGMVHPAYRRQGIGRVLLAAAQRECGRRGATGLVLVCEGVAPSGQAFARAVGAVYRDAEHRMALDRAAYARRKAPLMTLTIERAGMQDLETLLALRLTSHEGAEDLVRAWVMRWLRQANQRFYIGRLQGEPVGMLRLSMGAPAVFVQSLTVRPEHRGRGYGRQILVQALDLLIAEDRAPIMIEVATDNQIALSLYDSCGFQKVATYHYYWLPWPST
jgi:ribosomal protein S18 acetylase RimI-like enzyme